MQWPNQDGATAVEYAIMVAAIAVVVIVGALTLGETTSEQFVCTGSSIGAADNQCD